jgi:hypothetical protein
MNESSINGANNFPSDRWCNDEIAVHVESLHSLPPQPLPEKVRAQFLAERAIWAELARKDPNFHAELERNGIILTPEELREAPSAGNSEGSPPSALLDQSR